jgi:uncharacterized membrane protein required for colicin V production
MMTVGRKTRHFNTRYSYVIDIQTDIHWSLFFNTSRCVCVCVCCVIHLFIHMTIVSIFYRTLIHCVSIKLIFSSLPTCKF